MRIARAQQYGTRPGPFEGESSRPFPHKVTKLREACVSATYRRCSHVCGFLICIFRTAFSARSTFVFHALHSLPAADFHSSSIDMVDTNADPEPDCDDPEAICRTALEAQSVIASAIRKPVPQTKLGCRTCRCGRRIQRCNG